MPTPGIASRSGATRAKLSAMRMPTPTLLVALILGAGCGSRSDHHGFWKNGYPAAMLTDTSELRYPHYHCVDGAAVLDKIEDVWPTKADDVAELDHAFSTQIVRALVSAAEQALRVP